MLLEPNLALLGCLPIAAIYRLRTRARPGRICSLRSGPYRVYFYSHDLIEPPHVHLDREDVSARFWLNPVSLARNLGFKAKELRAIERSLVENESALLAAWQDHMGQEA